MVSLTKIYTRGGDTGETSLGDGNRVKKYDIREKCFEKSPKTSKSIKKVKLRIL